MVEGSVGMLSIYGVIKIIGNNFQNQEKKVYHLMLNGLEANSPLAERNHKPYSAITFCAKNIQFKIYVGQNVFNLLPKDFSEKR